jgi:hypothetical protein
VSEQKKDVSWGSLVKPAEEPIGKGKKNTEEEVPPAKEVK